MRVASSPANSPSPIRLWIVAKCCSASVSVGAISAACIPASATRSIAYSATTVFPDPTSPISRRCIGRPVVRSASISSSALALARRGLERQRLQPSAHEVSGRPEQLRLPGLALGAPAHHERELEQEQLLEREPPPGDRDLLQRLGPVRGRDRVGLPCQRRAGAQPRAQRLRRVVLQRPDHEDELADPPR